jgi:hypothetical protein
MHSLLKKRKTGKISVFFKARMRKKSGGSGVCEPRRRVPFITILVEVTLLTSS